MSLYANMTLSHQLHFKYSMTHFCFLWLRWSLLQKFVATLKITWKQWNRPWLYPPSAAITHTLQTTEIFTITTTSTFLRLIPNNNTLQFLFTKKVNFIARHLWFYRDSRFINYGNKEAGCYYKTDLTFTRITLANIIKDCCCFWKPSSSVFVPTNPDIISS